MSAPQTFDRRQLRRNRDRAAARLPEHDFLFREVAERLADRLDDVTRRFPLALDLGSHGGELAEILGGRGGIEHLVRAELSEPMLRRGPAGALVVADEEALPFADGSFDLIISNLSLHWVNDLPGALIQIRRALKPDGLFLATLLGGDTLTELRRAWMEAELAEENGASPRVSPTIDLRDAAGLLQRAGFTLPVADADAITVTYPDAMRLMADLRGMGEANAHALRRRSPTRRATLARMLAGYQDGFAQPDNRLPATFQVLTLTGWAPHPSQPRALAPGSASVRLADALSGHEIPIDDAPP